MIGDYNFKIRPSVSELGAYFYDIERLRGVGSFKEIDNHILCVDVSHTHELFLMGLMRTTSSYAHKLPSWVETLNAIEVELHLRGLDVEDLMMNMRT